MDRGRQVVRQWKLLQLLQGYRHGATIRELFERVEEPCVERTIRRDLEALDAAGFPLVESGSRWRLRRAGEGGWSIPAEPTMVVALMVSEELLEGSTLAAPLRELRGRVEAMLSPRARRFCEELRRRVAVNPPPAVRVKDDVEAVVDLAIRESRRIRIGYWSPSSGDTERTIEPLILSHVQGGLYVFGWDDRSGERRMFAMQRIAWARLTEERFEPDPTFDAAAYLRTGFGVMTGSVHRIVVDFAPRVAYLLRERAWHASQRIDTLDDGGLRATWTMGGLPEVARWLAGFGGDARVVAPEVLREQVARIHRGGLDVSGQSHD